MELNKTLCDPDNTELTPVRNTNYECTHFMACPSFTVTFFSGWVNVGGSAHFLFVRSTCVMCVSDGSMRNMARARSLCWSVSVRTVGSCLRSSRDASTWVICVCCRLIMWVAVVTSSSR